MLETVLGTKKHPPDRPPAGQEGDVPSTIGLEGDRQSLSQDQEGDQRKRMEEM